VVGGLGEGLDGGFDTTGPASARPAPLLQVTLVMLMKAQYSLLFNWMAVTYIPYTGMVNVKLYPPAQQPLLPAATMAAPEAGTSRITSPSSTFPARVQVPASHQKPVLRVYHEQKTQF